VSMRGVNLGERRSLAVPLTRIIDVLAGGTQEVWDYFTLVGRADKEAKASAIEAASRIEVMLLDSLGDQVRAAANGEAPPELFPSPETIISALQVGGRQLAPENEVFLLRLLQAEQRKQQNVNRVAQQAFLALPETAARMGFKEGSDEAGPVDPDWRERFRSAAGDVSSEEMQEVWGQVLAQEAVTPGSVSIRTLRVLADLSRREMELFTKVVPYLLDGRCVRRAARSAEVGSLWEELGIGYEDFNTLSAAGLLRMTSDSSLMGQAEGAGELVGVWVGGLAFVGKAVGPGTPYVIPVYMLTPAGIEIASAAAASAAAPVPEIAERMLRDRVGIPLSLSVDEVARRTDG